MRTTITIILFLSLNNCLSQELNDSIVFNQNIHKRIYEYTIPETPFEVFLIEFLNGRVEGTINISLNRKYKEENFDFEKKLHFRKKVTEYLFNELDKMDFQNFNQPTDEENCSFYLDGESTFFKVTTATIQKTLYFDGIYLNSTKKDCETNLKAQKILNLLDKKLNFKWRLEKLEYSLPTGKYSYMVGAVIKKFDVE